MQLSFVQPDDEMMKQIAYYVKEYALDNKDMQAQEFVAGIYNNTLTGFGRLKKHTACEELCTLGVVEEYRGKGIGKAIVNEIKKTANRPLYVVCIIPTYFEKMNFEIVHDNIPSALKLKHERCTNEFVVEEEYCVMKLNNE